MSEIVLKAEGLGLQTGRRYLLRDINWEVQQGQHWVVFGMNGSGKTTLLSIIAGFKKQTHGQLTILGQNYGPTNVLSLRRRIGWVSSSFFDNYYAKESALQIVLSGLFGTFGPGYGVTDQQILLAKNLLTCLKLADKLDQPFQLMSKGERQNVLIARALINAPEILVLDEPSTGLDVCAREVLANIVQKLSDQTKVTLIYVTHYTEEISPIFQNCLLLKHGRVYAKGPTSEMLTAHRLSAFLDYPVETTVQNGRTHLALNAHTGIKDLFKEQEAWL